MNLPINLEDLQSIITTLLANSNCACHIINPHKTRILMWKLKDGTYHLRLGIQKFTSSEQTDRNGETYWRYYALETKAPTNLAITNQPQEPAKEYATNTEQPTNPATV